ncbi:MAG: CHC2 zinc finger domain-containing protein [Bacteroidales bacterium]|nr:CHC2 zinc finger domain-containing protein [Bacteroidales bacterium]
MNKEKILKLRNLPIEEIAKRLGLQVNHHQTLCPFHSDKHPSLSFDTKRNIFKCWSCGEHGDNIDLVMKYLKKDFKAACKWLADESNIILVEWKPTVIQEETPTFDAKKYERFLGYHNLSPTAKEFLYNKRLLNPAIIEWCKISSWKDKEGKEWLQIPYFDEQGKLIGLQNRNLTIGDKPRFRFTKGSYTGIYNLRIFKYLKPFDEVYIAEGITDCLALMSAGHYAIAITSATLLNKEVCVVLAKLKSVYHAKVHMYPDKDKPGEELYAKLKVLLPGLIRHDLPEGCKDFSDYFIKQQKGLL